MHVSLVAKRRTAVLATALLWLAALLANFCWDKSNLSLRWMLAGLGVVLFVITIIVNIAARTIVQRSLAKSRGG
jgi:ABC-type phosphate transport system permease subunit